MPKSRTNITIRLQWNPKAAKDAAAKLPVLTFSSGASSKQTAQDEQ
jgi:hypothetical protein